jgi:pimeloyl-ACP methyl ester carboxylesterase
LPPLPPGLRSVHVDCGEVTLHAVTSGAGTNGVPTDDPRPAIVFLHGFPEYWAAWKPVLTRLASDYLVIAPDQRGYNLSDAPQHVEDYAARKLVSDIVALTSNLLGERRFILAGHDWGASVAYALAIGAPERLKGLVIVNGVHPVIFQQALLDDPEQARASQYFHRLRASDAAERMAENGFARTFSMFEKFSSTPWLTPEEKAGYLEAWSRPRRMNAMLNWYRASPIVVPRPGEEPDEAPLANAAVEKFRITMPHLLIWGVRDQALRPSSHAGLEAFAPDLVRVTIEDGDHWVIHTHGERIAGEIDRFAKTLD